jgi:hypothetical protein
VVHIAPTAALCADRVCLFKHYHCPLNMLPVLPAGVFQQRLRWSMGALQILMRTNPLQMPGLTIAQRLLFFEACAFYWLAIPTVIMMILPIVYIFTAIGPFRCEALWEFSITFILSFGSNRMMVRTVASIMTSLATELLPPGVDAWGCPSVLIAWQLLTSKSDDARGL